MTFWCARSLIQIFIVTFFFIIILVLIILIKYANNFNNVNDTCEHHHLTILLIHESIKNYLHYILFMRSAIDKRSNTLLWTHALSLVHVFPSCSATGYSSFHDFTFFFLHFLSFYSLSNRNLFHHYHYLPFEISIVAINSQVIFLIVLRK
jgi:hypothetical protein